MNELNGMFLSPFLYIRYVNDNKRVIKARKIYLIEQISNT